MSRAKEEQLEMLHNLVTNDIIATIQGEHSTADVRAAIEWLKQNGVTGPAAPESPLHALSELLNERLVLDESEVQAGLR